MGEERYYGLRKTTVLSKRFNDYEVESSILGLRHETSASPENKESSSTTCFPPVFVSTDAGSNIEASLLIHGHIVREYQCIYHSVVDPMLKTSAGDQKAYTLDLGRQIKQQLWERLFCPARTDTPQVDGQNCITESFSGAGLKRRAPEIEVDSREPWPQKPKKKKTRH